MESLVCLSLAIFVLAEFDRALSAKGSLEINYDKLSERFYHANNSNAIYGPEGTKIALGCMLPASALPAVQDAERNNLLWKKGNVDIICAQLEAKDACSWLDPSSSNPRGMKLLNFLLVDHSEDDFRRNLGASGTYTCYHSRQEYNEANVQVWVAGNLLEVLVNGTKMGRKMYHLPDKSASDADKKTIVLECAATAGAKNLVPDKQFTWYRNEQQIRSSYRFVLGDKQNRRLEIRNAGSSDGGVYMCEAEFEQQNGQPIKSRDYIVLKGDPTSMAASLLHQWHYQVASVLLLQLLRPFIRY